MTNELVAIVIAPLMLLCLGLIVFWMAIREDNRYRAATARAASTTGGNDAPAKPGTSA